MIIIDRNRAEGNKWKEVTMQIVYAMLIDDENIFDFVFISTWISKPITASKFIL